MRTDARRSDLQHLAEESRCQRATVLAQRLPALRARTSRMTPYSASVCLETLGGIKRAAGKRPFVCGHYEPPSRRAAEPAFDEPLSETFCSAASMASCRCASGVTLTMNVSE